MPAHNIKIPGAKPRGVSQRRYSGVPFICGGCGKQFAGLYDYTGHMHDRLNGVEEFDGGEVHTWVAVCLTPAQLRKGGWKKDGAGIWHAPVPNG